ncbi:hypothetical protein NMY22_g12012 [Coprinellus aureogranulatus]|nr:hypothetical protein NMY22_g12012 [Coprinellus aureogranulatus]
MYRLTSWTDLRKPKHPYKGELSLISFVLDHSDPRPAAHRQWIVASVSSPPPASAAEVAYYRTRSLPELVTNLSVISQAWQASLDDEPVLKFKVELPLLAETSKYS